MAYYLLDFGTIDDPSQLPAYVKRGRALIADNGGEIVARGLVEDVIEGTLEPSGRRPTTSTVIRFPDRESLMRVLDSAEWAELREIRKGFSTATFAVLRGFDAVSAVMEAHR